MSECYTHHAESCKEDCDPKDDKLAALQQKYDALAAVAVEKDEAMRGMMDEWCSLCRERNCGHDICDSPNAGKIASKAIALTPSDALSHLEARDREVRAGAFEDFVKERGWFYCKDDIQSQAWITMLRDHAAALRGKEGN